MTVSYLERLFIESDIIERLCDKAMEAQWPDSVINGLWELRDEINDEIEYQSQFDYNHL